MSTIQRYSEFERKVVQRSSNAFPVLGTLLKYKGVDAAQYPHAMPCRTFPASQPSSKQRELWGPERFFHFAHDVHGGAFDMVSIFEIDLGAEQLDLQNWISAWSVLADTFAVLSQRIEVDNGEGRIVDQGIRAEGLVFSGPNLPNDQQRINYCLQHRQFNAISLTVFDAREAKDEVVHLAVTNPHALADANGIFAIAKELIQSVIFQDQVTITTPNRASSQEQLTAPSPAPREDLGLKDMFEVAKKGSTIGFEVLPKETAIDPSHGMEQWRTVYTFTPRQTDALVKFCKTKHLTVSAWLQASILHAMLDVLTGDARGPKGAQTFTVPAMPFRHATKKSGATGTICAPISVKIRSTATVEDTAVAVADAFALARRFRVEEQDEYVKALLKVFATVRPEAAVPTFSSLGRLAKVKGLKSYQVASRNNVPSMGIHAWTLNDRLNVTLSWAPARFHYDHVKKFWSTWIGAITEVSA